MKVSVEPNKIALGMKGDPTTVSYIVTSAIAMLTPSEWEYVLKGELIATPEMADRLHELAQKCEDKWKEISNAN